MYVYSPWVKCTVRKSRTIGRAHRDKTSLGVCRTCRTHPSTADTSASAPTTNTPSSTEDIIPGLTPAKIPPWSIPYQLPAFSLDRPTARLTMEQRMQVYHNYISAVFNLRHKKDIINRLKRVEPHNISTYKAEMTRHIELHEDVLDRLLTNLKQDDYFRSLEDLLTIDSLQAYDDVRLFPELYDTTAVIERITSEVDLIERQLKRPGMYLLPSTPLPSVSGFVPRPSPTFKPIPPKGQPTVTSPRSSDQPQKDDSIGTSPGSSLPCGQGTPQDPPSSTNESPSWSPQHSPQQVLPQPNPPPTTPSSESQINPSAKPFILAAVAPQNVPSSPQQNIPKSTNGEGVKCSRQQGKSKEQDERLCFCCKQPGHLKRDCPELPYCSKCKTKGHVPARCPTKQQDAEQAPEGHEFCGPTHKGNKLHRDEWKRSQDQPRFSNPNNRCLNYAGNHSTHGCPVRHQHQASTTSNPTSGSGIYNNKSNPNISSPPNSSPPQNSQLITTPKFTTKSIYSWHYNTNPYG